MSCRRDRALVGIIADALRKSEAPTPPTAAAVAATVYFASTKQGLVSPLSNYSRSLARSLGSPQTDKSGLLDNALNRGGAGHSGHGVGLTTGQVQDKY